ncbi:unnamed protein product [Caenorhabditis auriculariae]|uniref:PH domain-containing protein n=1 Tax=Caenorhabditis auriculariae TaxID=2777116 RepID=A0A8S1H716_9PELO|nr:unnamed protein product [Caenorhabditis auriculariae]
MEEDNGHDILKSFAKHNSEDGFTGFAKVSFKGSSYDAKISMHGNVLCVWASSTDTVQAPLIFVLERITIKKMETEEAEKRAFSVEFVDPTETLVLAVDSEEIREQWMVKMATSSHQMARAELDELAYKFFTMSPSASHEASPTDASTSSFQNFYLTSPLRITHNYAVSQQNNLPARRVVIDEAMWETKLSMIVPKEMVKLYRKWVNELAALLESRQYSWPSSSIPALHEVLREVREVYETYEMCYEFVDNYSGPSFRKSTEKHRVAFGIVPTNLHVHGYEINSTDHRDFITCGTASAIPLRFQNGGISRLTSSLEVDPCHHDFAFWSKRQKITELKKTIGELSHKIDVEWKIAQFGKPDKVCLEIYAGIKQVYEKLKDTLSTIGDVERSAEILLHEERRRSEIGQKTETRVGDSIQNLLDSVDAMILSLNTKIAVIDTLDDDQSARAAYEKSAREAMVASLDLLLTLSNAVLEAQLFSLVSALHKTNATHAYFHLQIRIDFTLAHVVTIAATAILNRIQKKWTLKNDGSPSELILVVFSFLSAYGDERGMVEDAWEAWKNLESCVAFRLVRAPSAVCRTCIPIVQGSRNALKVSIPLPHDVFDNLPESLREAGYFTVRTAYFSIGVNHEATFGQSFGGIAFESTINQEAADRVNVFANRNEAPTRAREAVMELVNEVVTEASRKNLAIFECAMQACELLGGESVISCKSGKDRTGMAATLEQGRVLRQTCGFNSNQVTEVVTSLRREGVRRENCRKNVGRAVYSFSPFQMHFLPKAFRPPSGTHSQSVSS